MRKSVYVVLALAVIALFFLVPSSKPKPSPAPAWSKSAEAQTGRLKSIEGLQRLGAINKIVDNEVFIELWVGSGFFSIDFDHKKSLCEVVYAYNRSQLSDSMYLLDSQTGKRIGEFGPRGFTIY